MERSIVFFLFWFVACQLDQFDLYQNELINMSDFNELYLFNFNTYITVCKNDGKYNDNDKY